MGTRELESGCTRAREIDLAAFALHRAGAEWADFRAHYPGCAECAGEVARYAQLAAVLEREAAPASGHPAEGELLAFADASAALGAAARERVALHLAGCASCRREVAVLQRFDLAALAAAPSAAGAGVGERMQHALAWLADSLRFPQRAPALAFAAAAFAIAAIAVWSWRVPGGGPAEPSAPPLATASPPANRVTETAASAERQAVVPNSARVVEASEPPAEPSREIALAATPTAPGAATVRAAEAPGPEAIAPEPAREASPLAERIAEHVPTEPPRYAPGALVSGPLVRVGGVGRGADENAPSPLALAPPHIGLTARAAPSLYWVLPAPTPLPISLTIVSESAAAPLLDAALPGPHFAGVHALSLQERGVQLAPGVDYQWFVAVVRDPERRSRDLVSGAAIRFEPPSPEVAARLADARARLAHEYAEAGLWYDAYDQLSRWLASEPDAAILRAHRAALLEQVGLAAAAAGELSAGPASVPNP